MSFPLTITINGKVVVGENANSTDKNLFYSLYNPYAILYEEATTQPAGWNYYVITQPQKTTSNITITYNNTNNPSNLLYCVMSGAGGLGYNDLSNVCGGGGGSVASFSFNTNVTSNVPTVNASVTMYGIDYVDKDTSFNGVTTLTWYSSANTSNVTTYTVGIGGNGSDTSGGNGCNSTASPYAGGGSIGGAGGVGWTDYEANWRPGASYSGATPPAQISEQYGYAYNPIGRAGYVNVKTADNMQSIFGVSGSAGYYTINQNLLLLATSGNNSQIMFYYKN